MGDGVFNEILFDPSGKITDPQTLQRLKATPTLSPAESIKLSTFFNNANPTNAALSDRLLLYSLLTIVNDPDVLTVAQKKFILDFNFVDAIEDGCDHQPDSDGKDDGVPEPKGLPCNPFRFLRKPSGASDFGLLVDSLTNDRQQGVSFFVVGVAPANILDK